MGKWVTINLKAKIRVNDADNFELAQVELKCDQNINLSAKDFLKIINAYIEQWEK